MEDTNLVLYVARENSDMTEGRGPMRITGIFTREEDAFAKIKGRGVMGVGDGEICRVELKDGKYEVEGYKGMELYWGYRQRPDGRWNNGYVDLRDYYAEQQTR